MRRTIVLGLLAVLIAPALLTAQSVKAPERSIMIVPRGGERTGGAGLELGSFRNDVRIGDFFGGSLTSGPIAGIGIEFDLPVRWLDFRLTLDRSLGVEAVGRELVGFRECQTCPVIDSIPVYRGAVLADGSRWSLGMDVRYQPVPESWIVRPYAVGGMGLNVYRLDSSDLDEKRLSGPHGNPRSNYQFGAGVDFDVANVLLRLEWMLYVEEGTYAGRAITVGFGIPLR